MYLFGKEHFVSRTSKDIRQKYACFVGSARNKCGWAWGTVGKIMAKSLGNRWGRLTGFGKEFGFYSPCVKKP